MMIPAQTTKELLESLHGELITREGEPDYARYNVMETLDKRFCSFCNLIANAEDDLSIILSLIDKDPDCKDHSPLRKLQALVDYVEIACAIYASEPKKPVNTILH
ncbi:hypothetical protein MTBPR1_130057 [Candidatus Terasakiella magnetica]|uniref:Uncharacterized protein n=1 Tax=Candidatus Terasakiella magnetica TaxID=1867952 RepID=A0A1C3RF28_9PROT|nr:hypothetical protein [Candidatus Terasakiella magnetica]SCA55861.1 hypothetical protein MTBPR1_130057 [Candidatus Terasakiella magnetica]